MVSKRLFHLLFAFCLVATGCSSCEDDVGNGDGNGDAGANNVATDGGLDAGSNVSTNANIGTTDAGPDVALDACATPCNGGCCGAGDVCEMDRCVPACDQPLCNGVCCGGNEVCYAQECVAPGADCMSTEDCSPDEICEPTLGACLPRDLVPACEFVPPVGQFSPEVDCRWTPNPGDPNQGRVDVVATPAVANLTDDNDDGITNTDDVPDIVFLSYNLGLDGCCDSPATIRVVDGRCNADGTMRTIASINAVPSDSSAGIALGDLTNDGVPEIVSIPLNANGRPQGAIAYKRDAPDGSSWSVLWHNTTHPTRATHTRGGATISLADLEADGQPEVIIGNVVLNGADGTLKWDGHAVNNDTTLGVGNNGFLGPSSAVADVDLDGQLEVSAGNTLYETDGSEVWTHTFTTNNSSCGGNLPCDGFSAFANFDNDPEGEVVLVRLGEVFIFEHTGELLWQIQIPTDNCAANESGPPTVADFDGDGRPEIGTAAADFYTVLDMDCDADPVPNGCASRGVLWAVPNEDCTSRVTASSVFDFEGDGRAEMVYADEQNFRIYDGTDGTILYDDPSHGSHTRIEMPIVVDVDNDGNSEVIIPENSSRNGTPGLEVWADSDDNWVRTRRIWNQHGYHVTNINEDGSIPVGEVPNWSDPELNNYRQNVQPDGVFDAPNLVLADLSAAGVGCAMSTEIQISVTVRNDGALGMPPGVPVRIYVDIGGNITVIEDVLTTRQLLPGQSETFMVTWVTDDATVNAGFVLGAIVDPDEETNECVENDNESTLDSTSIEFRGPDLVIDTVDFRGQNCGMTQSASIRVTVSNAGTQTVPAGVPVEVSAELGGVTTVIGTATTTRALAAGQSEMLSVDWTVVPAAFIGQTFPVTATVDPNGVVYPCDEKNTLTQDGTCRIVQ